MINLTEDLLIGKGSERLCYRHPKHEERCIKITHAHSPRTEARIKRELKYQLKYTNRNKKLRAIPQYFGKEITNLGAGHVFELIVDYDGQISQCLSDCLQGNIKKSVLEQKMKDLYDAFAASKALVSDFNPANIAIRKKTPDDYELIIIDGFGNSDFVKIADYIGYFRRQKLIRKFKRLMAHLGLSTDHIC